MSATCDSVDQHGMTCGEDEAKEIVADVIVDGSIEIGHGRFLLRVELVAEQLVLALEQLVSAQKIDRAMFGSRHEPGTRIVGNAGLGPLLERDEERVLREILGLPDVSNDAREPGDHLRRFDSPHRIDGAVRTRVCHGLQSDERASPGQARLLY